MGVPHPSSSTLRGLAIDNAGGGRSGRLPWIREVEVPPCGVEVSSLGLSFHYDPFVYPVDRMYIIFGRSYYQNIARRRPPSRINDLLAGGDRGNVGIGFEQVASNIEWGGSGFLDLDRYGLSLRPRRPLLPADHDPIRFDLNRRLSASACAIGGLAFDVVPDLAALSAANMINDQDIDGNENE